MTRTAPIRVRLSAAEKYRLITEEFKPDAGQAALVEEFRAALVTDFVYAVRIAKAANVVLDRRAAADSENER
jgi:hypothetical protein